MKTQSSNLAEIIGENYVQIYENNQVIGITGICEETF